MLEGVSVILTKEQQLYAFEAFLAMRPEYVDQIRALWTICPGAVRRVVRVSVSIINTCTNVRSLACYPLVLLESVCRGAVFKHTKCVELTLIEFRVTWSTFMDSSLNGAKFFNQLEHLHFIGAFEYTGWAANWAMIPQFDNLNRISIAMGSYSQIQPTLFNKVIKSPKLKQVVVTTRLHGDEQQALQDAVQQIDHRFSVIHRRRRWKETNLWHEGLHDPDRFWKQATAEKDLPPVPRPTTTT
ncbi:hypothetical protein R3P38DRAFT_2867860 [Favolaschia claudopus]|uniref:Uncharacterized protein n=1 Tax=Favolaschia claudopus TaxID=2862362 RepID=A0AAW0DB89_9AGAR